VIGSREAFQAFCAAAEVIAIACLQPEKQRLLQQASTIILSQDAASGAGVHGARHQFGAAQLAENWLFDRTAFATAAVQSTTSAAATKKPKRKSDAVSKAGKKSKHV
jgi:hypothetical protein